MYYWFIFWRNLTKWLRPVCLFGYSIFLWQHDSHLKNNQKSVSLVLKTKDLSTDNIFNPWISRRNAPLNYLQMAFIITSLKQIFSYSLTSGIPIIMWKLLEAFAKIKTTFWHFKKDLSIAWPGCAVLQTLEQLKADNQRLRDENGALIRVISKLSK